MSHSQTLVGSGRRRGGWRSRGAVFALLLAAGGASAQTTTSTQPVGVLNYTLAQGTTTPISIPLFDFSQFSGICSSVAASTLTQASATWAANQFATAGAPFFVSVLSGGQAGRVLLITANTDTTLTVDSGSTSLLGDAANTSFAVAAGDRLEIFQGDTLASLFGDGSGANPLQLQGGTSPFAADTVQIYNGVKWVPYYFDTTAARNFWVKQNGDGTSQNALVLYPQSGILVGRRGVDMTFSVIGRVPVTAQVTQISGGTSSVALRFPADSTLGTLNFSGPGAWVSSDVSFSADKINLFNGVRWVAYWKTSAGLWKQVSGDGSDQSGKVIPAGTCLLVQKLGSQSDSTSFYRQDVPYPVN